MHTDDDTALIAERIKRARTEAGMSRKALSDATGISARTIERIENGEQEVTVQRVKLLATATGKSAAWLQGDEKPDDEVDEFPAPAPKPDPSRRSEPPVPPTTADVYASLRMIDTLRSEGFDGTIRQAMATCDQVRSMLAYQEPAALVEIASSRGIDRTTFPKAREIQERLENAPEAGHQDCAAIQERIIDTAILGVDLHVVSPKALQDMAKSSGLESDGWLGWSNDNALIEAVRPTARRMAFADQLPDDLRDFMYAL
ncbi:helix-turn-helix domain-containing protein [Thalassobaculum litoreum]|nr:helix-turn-helix transcriptional regulator [Thalassobaculum litoreum]